MQMKGNVNVILSHAGTFTVYVEQPVCIAPAAEDHREGPRTFEQQRRCGAPQV